MPRDKRVDDGRDADKRAACEGKVAFDDPAIAKEAASRRDKRHVYRCRHCRSFHVSNPREVNFKQKARRKPKHRNAIFKF